ncbi:hypothetical protein L6452_20753 [Arctium lappa]|uniref:Uncharacterized protein n=1 Tax=Arctium lappa TaxID=4217 RepID=A0ACB9BCQ4_ARCLA|nr:hypothetical protein L6452_20753 [Arctium lappa]
MVIALKLTLSIRVRYRICAVSSSKQAGRQGLEQFGAGAGIQPYLKACATHGVYCSIVITAVTTHNTLGFRSEMMLSDTVMRMRNIWKRL